MANEVQVDRRTGGELAGHRKDLAGQARALPGCAAGVVAVAHPVVGDHRVVALAFQNRRRLGLPGRPELPVRVLEPAVGDDADHVGPERRRLRRVALRPGMAGSATTST